MLERLRQAKEKGCDAVDPDNIDGYSEGNNNGIGETIRDATSFMEFLAVEAHHRGLAIGLKNSGELAANKTLVKLLDFAVVEECFTNTDDSGALDPNCADWSNFYLSSPPKPVYSIEYPINSKNKPVDMQPWSISGAAARCSTWAAFGQPNIKVDLKNYYHVDCGVARCSSSGPSPTLTTVSRTVSNGFTTTAALVVPSGCTN